MMNGTHQVILDQIRSRREREREREIVDYLCTCAMSLATVLSKTRLFLKGFGIVGIYDNLPPRFPSCGWLPVCRWRPLEIPVQESQDIRPVPQASERASKILGFVSPPLEARDSCDGVKSVGCVLGWSNISMLRFGQLGGSRTTVALAAPCTKSEAFRFRVCYSSVGIVSPYIATVSLLYRKSEQSLPAL